MAFKQRASYHLSGGGCVKCYNSSQIFTNDEFIEKSKKIHGNKYDYSKVKYIDSRLKIIIICKKHGEFEQNTHSHLSGFGCPTCRESSMEKNISKILDKLNVFYERQKKFDNCKYKQKLSFDFYLPNNNICIEYNGEQHYKSIKYWGGDVRYENQKIRDRIKKSYCKKNNIKLIILHYRHKNIESILEQLLHQ